MKYNNKFQNPKKLRGGGAEELGFNYFYEKNKQYVKKWKEVLVNRQLFEMWHALPVEEQKVWIDKATSFDKLFAMTNNLVLKSSDMKYYDEIYDKMTTKYPKKEIHNFVYKSGHEYFMYALQEFNKFVHQRVQLNPTPNLQYGHGDPKKYDLTFLKQSFQSWKESSKYPNIDVLILEYKDYIQSYHHIWVNLSEEGRQEWHDALDALEHAYDMFCEKTKITNPEMKVTDEDVKDHLSRMWEALDTETQNTWIVSAGETLPVRQRRVRGLFEDSDSDKE